MYIITIYNKVFGCQVVLQMKWFHVYMSGLKLHLTGNVTDRCLHVIHFLSWLNWQNIWKT